MKKGNELKRDPAHQAYLESIINDVQKMLDRHIEEMKKREERIDNN